MFGISSWSANPDPTHVLQLLNAFGETDMPWHDQTCVDIFCTSDIEAKLDIFFKWQYPISEDPVNKQNCAG